MRVAFVQGEQFVGKSIGSYTLERLIGQGQWNAVYQAQQHTQRRSVLLTLFFLPETLSAQARQHFITRLYQEGKSLATLQHPNILPVLEVGEKQGYPYLVTAFAQGNSLAAMLKQEGRLTPEQTLEVLKPISEALEYAHGLGIAHGALSASNILLDAGQAVRITSFGFNRILSAQGIPDVTQPQKHLLSFSGTPLPGLDYVAPEVVQGNTADARADIYALGTLLFELLCGRIPFQGSNALDRAQQHVKKSVPALSSVHTDIPNALDLVVHLAVRRDPTQRVPSAGQVVRAFERALNVLAAASAPIHTPSVWDRSSSLAPTMDWAVDDDVSVHTPAIHQSSHSLGISTKKTQAIQSMEHQQTAQWSAAVPPPLPNPTPVQSQPPFIHTQQKRQTNQPPTQKRKLLPTDRRKAAVVLATGGLLSVGALSLGIVGITNLLKPKNNGDDQDQANNPNTDPTSESEATMTPPTPTATPKPKPTAPPVMPIPPRSNKVREFMNSTDGQASLLITLPDGTFVAFEKRCTHQGTPVYYDEVANLLVCPAHGSRFDPVHRGEAVGGESLEPLIPVPVQVQADGSIVVMQ